MSKIHAYHALVLQVRGENKGVSDVIGDQLGIAAHRLERAILMSRAQSRADLDIKLALWSELIEDPQCILDDHRGFWRVLLADIALLSHAAEHPERYPEIDQYEYAA